MASNPLAVRPGKDAEKMLRSLEDMRKKAANHRLPFEKGWYLNLAFFQGEQWWGYALGKFGRPKMEPWRNLFVDNKVQPAVLSEVAKITKNQPIWDGVPGSADQDAVADAILATRVVKGKWEDLAVSADIEQVVMWAQIVGTCFAKLTWDPLASGAGKEVAINPETGKPLAGPGGALVVKGDEVAGQLEELAAGTGLEVNYVGMGQGDVQVNVRSPFDMLIDPLAGDDGLKSARWVIEEAIRAPEDLKARFKLAEEPKADAAPSPGLVEARMPGTQSDGEKMGVRTWELWEKPSAKFPEGRHAVWCKDVLLAHEANATKDAALPYAMYRARPVPGRFWGMSLVDQIRPLNLELNKSRSQTRENAARISNPPLLWPKDMQGSKWEGMPGEVVQIDPYAGQPGGPGLPSFMPVPSLPGYVQSEPALIEASIDRAAHQSEVSRGAVPAGVTAASAIQLLQEADQTIIGMDAKRFEQFVSETGRLMLDLIAEHYRTERLIQIAGEDGTYDVVQFRSGQWNRDVPTVRVKAGSLIPRSPAARQAQMNDILTLMVQHGYPIDPVSMGAFLKNYEVGGLEQLMGAFSEDATQIARENLELLQLEVEAPPVNLWDNHTAHKRGHEGVMKSRRWAVLGEDEKNRFVAHWSEHEKALQDAQMVEAQQAMAAQGAAGAGQGAIGAAQPQVPGGDPAALAAAGAAGATPPAV